MKNLVIVESPTKARTIGRFLGDDYKVIASMGHIYDLPKSKLGVDVENKFDPEYVLIESKKNIIDDLKKESKKAERIIMATDLDREGEAIAFHIAKNLDKKNIDRIIFHEITQEAIDEALSNPKKINEDLVDAQTARRVLDRLVGYKLSPILWQKVRRGLSAGRVQSVALRLIVEREKEIEKFVSEKYWTIHAVFEKKEKGEFELIEILGEKIEFQKTFKLYDGEYKVTQTNLNKKGKAKEMVAELGKSGFIVSDVVKKQAKRSPGPPFTTSTLQQDASRRFGYSGKRTMSLAQKLYEEGFITYHRTDSVSMANQAIFSIRNYVEKQYGDKYLPKKPRFDKTKQKLAQEAHEAIRPTKVGVLGLEIGTQLGKDYLKLYELIWN